MPTLVRQIALLARGAGARAWVVVVLLAGAVSAVEVAAAALILRLIEDITGGELAASSAVLVGAVFVLRALLVVIQANRQAVLTERIGATLAGRLHRAQLALPYELRPLRTSAQQLRDAHDTVQSIVRDVLSPLPRLVSETALTLALVTLLLVSSPYASVAAAVVLVPLVLGVVRSVHPRLEARVRRAQALSQQSLQLLQESSLGLADIRLSGEEQRFERRFDRVRRALADARSSRVTLLRVPSVVTETGLVLFVVGFLIVSATDDAAPDSLGVLGVFGYAAMRLRPSLDLLLHGVESIRSSRPAIAELVAELEREPGERPEVEPLPLDGALVLDDVWFTHPSAAQPALRGISVTIERGTHVAFVGPTGGGKTTLIEVLVGLLQPSSGSVRVDGVDLVGRERAWQRSLGVVPQFPTIFDGTLLENVALGVDADAVDRGRAAASMRAAQLDDLLAGLPDGMDATVGERGVRLSGGQRQRVAIARALYRDPAMLVLDEGTASLDGATERALLDAVRGAGRERTVVAVAHRLSTVLECDVIHVVEDGAIVASGSYGELLEGSDRFRRLVSG